MKEHLLRIAQKLISKNLPGRFVLASAAAKLLSPQEGKVLGWIGSYHVELDLRDWIQQQIFFGIYERTETSLLQKFLRPGDRFFDIGANVGYYSFLASQIIGANGRVHSFEPISANVRSIQRNVLTNQIMNMTLLPAAVGLRKGTLLLYVEDGASSNTGWASKVESPRRKKQVIVPMVSLDDYIREEQIDHVDLIKMDIEGSELDALRGGINLFSDKRGPDIICEVNPFLLHLQNLDSSVLTKCLADYGYFLYRSSDLCPIKPENEFSNLTNLFCTKKPHFNQ